MTTEWEGPAASRIRLGDELATLFEQSGFDLEFVANKLGCSDRKIRRILDGATGVKNDDLTQLLNLFNVSGSKRSWLEILGRESQKRRPRVPGGSHLPDKWQRMYRLEEAAQGIWEYSPEIIPGLLQTPGYARAVFEGVQLHTPEKIERLIQNRLNRQSRLLLPGRLKLRYILSEGTLHWQVGGSEVMRAQLLYLVELQELPQITIQIMPFNAGAHAGFGCYFTVLEQPAGTQDRVSIDTMFDSLVLDEEERVAPYRQMYSKLAAIALPPEQSTELIATVAEGL